MDKATGNHFTILKNSYQFTNNKDKELRRVINHNALKGYDIKINKVCVCGCVCMFHRHVLEYVIFNRILNLNIVIIGLIFTNSKSFDFRTLHFLG